MRSIISKILECICILSAGIFGAMIVVADHVYKDITRFNEFPIGFKTLLCILFGLVILSLFSQIIFYRKIAIWEAILAIVLLLCSLLLCSMVLLKTELSFKSVLLDVGIILLQISIAYSLSSLILYLRNRKLSS